MLLSPLSVFLTVIDVLSQPEYLQDTINMHLQHISWNALSFVSEDIPNLTQYMSISCRCNREEANISLACQQTALFIQKPKIIEPLKIFKMLFRTTLCRSDLEKMLKPQIVIFVYNDNSTCKAAITLKHISYHIKKSVWNQNVERKIKCNWCI